MGKQEIITADANAQQLDDDSRELATINGKQLLQSDSALVPANMGQVVELAQLMAKAGPAVPKDFRGAPGLCAAVIFQALHWKANPFSLASLAYVVSDKVAYEAKAINAAILAHANLKDGLDCEYKGTGPERVCIVSGHINGQTKPRVYESPMLKDINPKNSPLWKSDPDQQLWYYSSRSWARKWAPHVLLGVYAPDEVEDARYDGGTIAAADKPAGAVSALLAVKKPVSDGSADEDRNDIDQEEAEGEPASEAIDVEPEEIETDESAETATEIVQPEEEKPAEKAKRKPRAKAAPAEPENVTDDSPAVDTDSSPPDAAGLALDDPGEQGETAKTDDAAEIELKPDAPFQSPTEANNELDRILPNLHDSEDVNAYMEGWRDMVKASFDNTTAMDLTTSGDRTAQRRRLEIAKADADKKKGQKKR